MDAEAPLSQAASELSMCYTMVPLSVAVLTYYCSIVQEGCFEMRADFAHGNAEAPLSQAASKSACVASTVMMHQPAECTYLVESMPMHMVWPPSCALVCHHAPVDSSSVCVNLLMFLSLSTATASMAGNRVHESESGLMARPTSHPKQRVMTRTS